MPAGATLLRHQSQSLYEGLRQTRNRILGVDVAAVRPLDIQFAARDVSSNLQQVRTMPGRTAFASVVDGYIPE